MQPPSAKGLAVFRDPNPIKRTATSIDWHPEGPSKIAVSYSILRFQDPRFLTERLPVQSYIWDVMNPNTPDCELVPASPLCCLRFNPKNPDTLIGGSYNGLVSFFDLRKSGSTPHETSVIENSHHDPVYDVFWTQSKTGSWVGRWVGGWQVWSPFSPPLSPGRQHLRLRVHGRAHAVVGHAAPRGAH